MPLYGPVWPLKIGNHDTYEVYEDLKSQISFYLRNLILTSPGENISDANYGVGLKRFLFEQNTDYTRSLIGSTISTQISSYMPFISLEDVIVEATSEDIDTNNLKIKILYTISGDPLMNTFELQANETQNIGFY